MSQVNKKGTKRSHDNNKDTKASHEMKFVLINNQDINTLQNVRNLKYLQVNNKDTRT